MFTGLIEETGTVIEIVADGAAQILIIRANLVSADAKIGDSVAINGCCLTVVSVDGHLLGFEAGSETLGRTNLGQLGTGSPVNLERSLKVGDRLGGHYVSGHVDSVGTIKSRQDDGKWSEFWFSVPRSLTRQMAPKGSVAVDGISLTLVEVEPDCFSVALIPHTLSVTTLGSKRAGDLVNIETDLLAKYVQQQLSRNG